jgi:TMEM175 potassium channel family protein
MARQVVRYQRDDQEFGRAIGFFDATYALALTLLVTTLDVPEPSSAWATFPALWNAVGPQFLAFGISFAVIASYWLAHHRLVRTLAAVDQPTIIANLVLVASIVVIPFSTNAVGDPGVENLPLPTAFLAVNIALASGLHTLVYMLAYRRKLFLVKPSARQVQGAIVIGLSVGMIVLASVPLAYLASPVVAQLCWLLIIPIRVVARRWAADSADGSAG